MCVSKHDAECFAVSSFNIIISYIGVYTIEAYMRIIYSIVYNVGLKILIMTVY